MIEVTFHSDGEIADHLLQYAVIAARYEDKWVLCRHKERTTWEIPGGHRETGETIEEAARRELQEETGARVAEIQRVTDYGVTKSDAKETVVTTYGTLFFAKITESGPLDPTSEIAETALFDVLPENLTYPEIQPQLHLQIQLWINFQSHAGELWDVYDEERNLTGRTHRRGDPLKPGERHLVVHIWLRNAEGKFLLTKRAPTKGYPNMWECTGGSALAGDDSLTAAIREVQEETGLTVLPEHGRCLYTYPIRNNFTDVWLFSTTADLSEVVLQEGETTDAMYATREEIMQMYRDGILVPFPYIDHIFDRMDQCSL
ncbi:MAG: NUDIX domain-containing protein [Lachnospiraceae bacterium]|nr:NUDIX domain-containing protein [Lachnospiraceae bacterium]